MRKLEKRKGIPSCKGYYVAKSGERFRYDSMSELALMLWLDNKSGRKWRKNTKLRIPYLFENKQRKYIPDFIVEEDCFSLGSIVEIKGSNDKPELPFKCEAAEKYCKENALYFSLVSYQKVKQLIDWQIVKDYHNQHK